MKEKKYCKLCGKPLNDENNSKELCWDCERELREEDKAWDEFFKNIKTNKENV